MPIKDIKIKGIRIYFELDTVIDDCYYMYIESVEEPLYKAPILIEDSELESIIKKMNDLKNKIKDQVVPPHFIRKAAVGAVQLTKKWG